jgi:hypothetical protein
VNSDGIAPSIQMLQLPREDVSPAASPGACFAIKQSHPPSVCLFICAQGPPAGARSACSTTWSSEQKQLFERSARRPVIQAGALPTRLVSSKSRGANAPNAPNTRRRRGIDLMQKAGLGQLQRTPSSATTLSPN